MGTRALASVSSHPGRLRTSSRTAPLTRELLSPKVGAENSHLWGKTHLQCSEVYSLTVNRRGGTMIQLVYLDFSFSAASCGNTEVGRNLPGSIWGGTATATPTPLIQKRPSIQDYPVFSCIKYSCSSRENETRKASEEGVKVYHAHRFLPRDPAHRPRRICQHNANISSSSAVCSQESR